MAETAQFLTDSEGRRIAVVLPVAEYEELLEDIHDLAIIAERREESTISFDEVKRRLRTDGFLRD